LALEIGGTTAVFSLVNSILLRREGIENVPLDILAA